ncbi:hypothetical protein C2G38_2234197 [Gigaspora rosea]|uniref:Uncharacterized protein n=1 Tax=Gigaspora rosea TaxID=44941 RepID=A0A397TUW3_9GLOM|nr:hypothetical protein C2G38_2234197 [Gigaspora rosea]
MGCIIADEHQGQALGLGKYLYSKYCHLSSEEHLKHIYKLYQIHFNRNIRNKAISNETKELMYLIIKLNTQEILHVLEKIKNSNESGAAGDDFDQWQWHSAKTYKNYNIHETYKDKSELGRLTNNSKRSHLHYKKKRKNKALDKNTEDLFSILTSTSTIIPTMQEQDNYSEWKNKKLEYGKKV